MKSRRLPALLAVSLLAAAPALADVDGYEIVTGETALDATPVKQLIVTCPKTKKALGAGWAVLDKTDAILDGQALTNQPAYDGSHWLVNAKNESAFAKEWKLKVWVTCAKTNP
ncbi:hypothetical protein [Hyphococcus sp.]|uniref:hypothetical protein n=1 Tax=Hyphococcus sp. TaxID=2038636 RepID=UPI002084B243|nr:MAG: hypothetical protein DHS20C04_21180 [Marinicaulis sp.]